MHSLLPDSVRIYRKGEPEPVADIPLMRTRHAASPALIEEHGIETIALSMGVQLAGALVNNNYPAALLDMSIPGEPVVDLGAIDLFRDRERGVPPYNQLRAELGLNRVRSFDELTENVDAGGQAAGAVRPARRRVRPRRGHGPAGGHAVRRPSPAWLRLRRDAVPDLHPQRAAGGCSATGSSPTTSARGCTPAKASTGSTRPR